jgi:hypothetical protein
MAKITVKDFKLFKDTVFFWIKKFGLFGWEVVVERDDIDLGSLATCQTDYSSRTVTITLNEEWIDPITPKDLKAVAFEEVCHILFGKIEQFARLSCSEHLVDEEIHRIIRILEKIFLEKF